MAGQHAPYRTSVQLDLAGVGEGTILVNANEAMWKFFEHYSLPAHS